MSDEQYKAIKVSIDSLIYYLGITSDGIKELNKILEDGLGLDEPL